MGGLSIGQVVLARFPFSDLTSQKLRPCLILGEVEFDDLIVCQIISKRYSSKRAIVLKKDNFRSGSIVIDSYIRPDKLATLDQKMITKTLGTLHETKLGEVKNALKRIFELQ